MYRFLLRPKWIAFHVLVVLGVILMVSLARWQWDKHNRRDEFTEMVDARRDAEPVELAPLLRADAPSEIEYRRVTAAGEYLPERQFVVVNRTQDGVSGVDVLTPFQVDGGPIIIVNRGFIAVADDDDLADGSINAAPQGRVIAGGTARTSERRRTGEVTDRDETGMQIRRVDLTDLADRLDVELAPIYIDLIATDPPSPAPPTPVGPPDLSGGPPHVGYAVQWVIFSISLIVGWILAIRRSAKRRVQSTNAASSPEVAPAAPTESSRSG